MEAKLPMRSRQDPKIKLTVYVSSIVAEQLDFACKDRTKNKSKLTETALSQLLSPKHEDQQDAAMSRRLDRLTRDIGVINRHQQIVIESLGLFIRHYLMTSPMMPPSEQHAALAMGHQRFQRFIEQLGRRLASTTTFANEITDQLASHSPKSNGSSPTAQNRLQGLSPQDVKRKVTHRSRGGRSLAPRPAAASRNCASASSGQRTIMPLYAQSFAVLRPSVQPASITGPISRSCRPPARRVQLWKGSGDHQNSKNAMEKHDDSIETTHLPTFTRVSQLAFSREATRF